MVCPPRERGLKNVHRLRVFSPRGFGEGVSAARVREDEPRGLGLKIKWVARDLFQDLEQNTPSKGGGPFDCLGKTY